MCNLRNTWPHYDKFLMMWYFHKHFMMSHAFEEFCFVLIPWNVDFVYYLDLNYSCSLKAFHSVSGEQHVHCVPGHRRPDRGPYRHANQCHLHIHRGMDIRSCRLPVLDCRRLPCLHSFNSESVYPQSGSILVRHFTVEISEEENEKASYVDDFNCVVCV